MKPHKKAARERRGEVIWKEYLRRKRAGVLPSQTRNRKATAEELEPTINFIGPVGVPRFHGIEFPEDWKAGGGTASHGPPEGTHKRRDWAGGEWAETV